MDDDPKYTRILRVEALRYRYSIMHAGNGGVAILNAYGELAAAFSTCSEAAEWMETRCDEFQKQAELAA